jgi:hypothetical protein
VGGGQLHRDVLLHVALKTGERVFLLHEDKFLKVFFFNDVE